MIGWPRSETGMTRSDASKTRSTCFIHSIRDHHLPLPAAHLIASKVDHERSEELYARRTRFVPFLPGLTGLRSEVWKHGDLKLQELARDDQYAEPAKLHAERVLNDLFQGLGWTVAYQWQNTPLTQ